MPGENVQDWSRTAASNSNADSSIGWAEGMARAAVNDSARSMMAGIAKWRDLMNGSRITGGTANAQTFTSGMSFTSVPTNFVALLKHSSTNTASMTLNMDGIGGVVVNSNTDGTSALRGGEAHADGYGLYTYNGTYWIQLWASGVATPLPSMQTFTTATSGTYTTPANVRYIEVQAVGGGGGGGGGASGGTGGDTTFGSMTAGGGSGGGVGLGGSGGTATAGDINISGGGGDGGAGGVSGAIAGVGGAGGNSFFGGGGLSQYGNTGGNGAANSGGGGGGGGYNGTGTTIQSGSGGGGGAYCFKQYNNPTSSYSYSVGSGGAAGVSASNITQGGVGGSGVIIVREYY